MDIAEIETFVTIAALGGFTRAAQRLNRTQPAISRRLGLLEQELGAPLFERIRGNVRLTEAGRVFRPHAEAALAALKDGRDAVRVSQTGIAGPVSLALVGTLADTHVVDVLRAFARRAKDVRLELRTASSAEVSNLVRRGEASLGLRYFNDNSADLISLDAGREAMLVVAAAGHPLSGRRVRDPRGLIGERWIGFPPLSGDLDSSGNVLARQLVSAGLSAAEVVFIDSLTAQKRLAQAGFGLALVPASSVRDELRRGLLVALDVPAMHTAIPVFAIHRRRGYLSPAATALLELLTASSAAPAPAPRRKRS
jgi:DNA-binding transcriptional LysR family regulator